MQNNMEHKNDFEFRRLSTLFFTVRQIIRGKLPAGSDPHMWFRLEVLRHIDCHEGLTMRDIARFLRITAPSATSLVEHLLDLGLVVRKRGTDKREVRVSLSKKGHDAVTAYHRHSERVMRAVFSKLSKKDVEDLSRILETLSRSHDAS